MDTVTEHLRRHLLTQAGVLPGPDYEQLRQAEWSTRFEWLMRYRLIMGVYRGYGRLGDPGKPQFDRVRRIQEELERFNQDHNLERMVEIATHALLEFVECDHPDRHYAATDSDGAGVRRYAKGQEQ